METVNSDDYLSFEYPRVISMKGRVEINASVCLPIGKKGASVCDGELVVHADEAELIRWAVGNVRTYRKSACRTS
jgi:hypothetical protein